MKMTLVLFTVGCSSVIGQTKLIFGQFGVLRKQKIQYRNIRVSSLSVQSEKEGPNSRSTDFKSKLGSDYIDYANLAHIPRHYSQDILSLSKLML